MSLTNKFFDNLGLSLITITVSLILWANIYIIEDEVTDGEAYGFNIGDTKEETFDRARFLFGGTNDSVWIERWWEGRPDPCRKSYQNQLNPTFSTECKLDLLRSNLWNFYHQDNSLDSVRLTFKKGYLIRIYRHRSFIEGF